MIVITAIAVILVSCKQEEMVQAKRAIITIDDAPGFPEQTIKMLNMLNKHKVKATFFCVGKELELHQEIGARIAEEHTLANHTFNHIHLNESNLEETEVTEISRTQNMCDSINISHNKETNRLFRAPYGAITASQEQELQSKYEVCWWNVDGSDWDPNKSLNDILADIHSQLNESGEVAVLLFHLTENSVIAMDSTLTYLKKNNIKIIQYVDNSNK